ncbi:hypothetical protein CTAYLR_005321 [Chrysophaeum taylorii]|uniref:Uncharacterized protein n=1 Tax=Chrysophaeum taylorii TaxID=2483200 RepID=A0AAD7XH99_9STRA|nr:hypothetical protein CTAYLR_005321 [Chrysophaeum taylorii]
MVTECDQLILQLIDKLGGDHTLQLMLESSLTRARNRAAAEMDPELFAALPWPQDVEQYAEYLTRLSRWVPQQPEDPVWREPWRASNGVDSSREGFDRTCHFYYLLDQRIEDVAVAHARKHMVTEVLDENYEDLDYDASLREDPWFGEWLKKFSAALGTFLDEPVSFGDGLLDKLQAARSYELDHSLVDGHPFNAPSGWRTFNQFLNRAVKAAGRPVDDPSSNAMVVSPVDGTIAAVRTLDENATIVGDLGVQHTHVYADARELLGAEDAAAFAGGSVVRLVPGPYASRRFVAPVAGVLKEVSVDAAPKTLRLAVGLSGRGERDGRFVVKPEDDGFDFVQHVGRAVLESDVGPIAVVPVAANKAQPDFIAQEGAYLEKGDDLGFGASDVLLFLNKDVRLDALKEQAGIQRGKALAKTKLANSINARSPVIKNSPFAGMSNLQIAGFIAGFLVATYSFADLLAHIHVF